MEVICMLSRTARAAIAIGTAAAALGVAPAFAQYYRGDGYGYGRPPAYYDEDPRPRRHRGVGRICVTGRGSCMSEYPAPFNAPCACTVPGFGIKRGQIGG
jgi:hypothetical protein